MIVVVPKSSQTQAISQINSILWVSISQNVSNYITGWFQPTYKLYHSTYYNLAVSSSFSNIFMYFVVINRRNIKQHFISEELSNWIQQCLSIKERNTLIRIISILRPVFLYFLHFVLLLSSQNPRQFTIW